MDILTLEQRKRNMKAIKNKDTKIERLLAKSMWAKKIRYRKNVKTIFGKPDFAIAKYKIVIFCDSEFFHGKDWEIQKQRIKTNKEFWIKKIEGNMKRDILVNETLKKEGWTVLRFWGEQIKKDINQCVDNILKIIEIKKKT